MVKTGRIHPMSELFLSSFHNRSIIPMSPNPKRMADMRIARKEEKRKEMGLSDQSEGRASLPVYIGVLLVHWRLPDFSQDIQYLLSPILAQSAPLDPQDLLLCIVHHGAES
jgi:hypothetical protein